MQQKEEIAKFMNNQIYEFAILKNESQSLSDLLVQEE